MTITLTWWIVCLTLTLTCPILAWMLWPRNRSDWDFGGVFEALSGIIIILVIWLIGSLIK